MGKLLPRFLVLPDATAESSYDGLALKDPQSNSCRSTKPTAPAVTFLGDRPSLAGSVSSSVAGSGAGTDCSRTSSNASNSSRASSQTAPAGHCCVAVPTAGGDQHYQQGSGGDSADVVAGRRPLPPLPSLPLPLLHPSFAADAADTAAASSSAAPLTSRAHSVSGMELARLALSSCSAAERELHTHWSSENSHRSASPAALVAAKLGLPDAAGRHAALSHPLAAGASGMPFPGSSGSCRARPAQSEGGPSVRSSPLPVAGAVIPAATAEAQPASEAPAAAGGGGGGKPGAWGRLTSMARGPAPAAAAGGLNARHKEEAEALPAGASAAAMRVLAELQERDEFSLVAAARQRSRRSLVIPEQRLRSMPSWSLLQGLPAAGAAGGGGSGDGTGVGGEAGASTTRRDGEPQRATQQPSMPRTGAVAATQLPPSSSAPSDFPELMSRVRSCPDVARLLADLHLGEFADAEDGDAGGTTSPAASPSRNGAAAASSAAAQQQLSPIGGRIARARAEATARSTSGSQLPPALPSPVAGNSRLSRSSSTGLTYDSLSTPGRSGGGSSNNVAVGGGGSRQSSHAAAGSRSRAHVQSDMGLAGFPAVDECGEDGVEESAAAVRALAARYGSAAVVPDDSGGGGGALLLGLDLQDLAFRDKGAKLREALQAANPAAYSEEAAEAAEAAYRALAERAKLRLKRLQEEPTTEEAVERQLKLAVTDLGSQRPFFMPPVLGKARVERPFTEKRQQQVVQEHVWTLDDSIFAQRKKENEARDLFDTEKVHKQQLSLDWQRVVSKTRFRKMVARGDLGVKNDGQRLDEELNEVRQELEKQAGFIRSAFNYYSMVGGGISSSDILQMGANVWLNFCNDAGIVHPSQRGCTVQDLQTIFISVNFEEESETAEAEANDDDAMMRFEFMEGIVRAAFGKYIASKQLTDMSDAVARLLEESASCPDLPPEAKVDPNDFRRNRFYTEQVEVVIKEYYDLLFAAFKLYKARDRCKLFWPEHWAAFLDGNKLLGLATGVERREAKLIFGWSQALVTDELRRRQRAVSLTFWDFVEAVARLADLISAPDHEDIIGYFMSEGEEPPELDRLVYEYYRHVGDAGTDRKRDSAELVVPPSRPLEVKLRLLLEYLVVSLREAWGGKDAKDVAAKVLKMATYLSGGIEMG